MDHEGCIRNKTHIVDFLFGGKAQFSLRSKKTGKSLAFAVTKKHGYWAVFHEPNSLYLGAMTKVQGDQIKFKPVPSYTCTAVDAFDWFCRHFTEYDRIELWHHGECSMCGRPLTDAKSIERGIGPICYEKLSKQELPF